MLDISFHSTNLRIRSKCFLVSSTTDHGTRINNATRTGGIHGTHYRSHCRRRSETNAHLLRWVSAWYGGSALALGLALYTSHLKHPGPLADHHGPPAGQTPDLKSTSNVQYWPPLVLVLSTHHKGHFLLLSNPILLRFAFLLLASCFLFLRSQMAACVDPKTQHFLTCALQQNERSTISA